MLKGACRDAHSEFSYDIDPMTVLGLKQKKILCYKNWRKIAGEPKEHVLVDYVKPVTCEKHITDCND